MLMTRAAVVALLAVAAAPAIMPVLAAQDPASARGTPVAAPQKVDFITPHVTDSHHLDYPTWRPPFVAELELPRFAPVQIGPLTLDLSPTKHIVMLWIAALLCLGVLLTAARAHERHTGQVGHPKGFAGGIEVLVLYLRNEVAIPNLGHGGQKFVPFILTLFFFILFANLLGLIPYGSTATGNISVTATLAIVTFLVIEVAGIRALGWGYIQTIVYWPSDMPLVMKLLITPIMTPIEIISKFTKPFALAIRLFANMTAGHIVILALIGLIFTFGAPLRPATIVAVAPLFMAIAIMMLEVFISLLQAFIFALLSSVFIGLIRESHH
jgi:F-type H+-transporting ATPase subunit a